MCANISDEMQRLASLETPLFINHEAGSLRPYQQYGYKFLLACSNLNYNAILADDLGLGKTLQTIALLAGLA